MLDTRTGATPVANGTNFLGGNLLSTSSYFSYGDGGTFAVPKLTLTNPNFVYVDGTAASRVTNAWIIQGGGAVNFTTGTAGLTNSRYELRAGTITSAGAFQVNDNSTFRITGGTLNLTGFQLRQERGTSLVDIAGGNITTRLISFAQLAGSTDGSKVLRFSTGSGVLTLTDTNPVRTGNDGSPTNDFIDFTTGSRGKIVSQVEGLSYFQTLYNTGYLRVNATPAVSLPRPFADYFFWTPTGTFELSLRRVVGLTADYNNSGVLDPADIDQLYTRFGAPTGTFDRNNDGTVSRLDVDHWILTDAGTRYGDANIDGNVNFADLLIVAQNYNAAVTGWAGGSFDGNATVDFADLLVLAQNYGFGELNASNFSLDWALARSMVPEPTTLMTIMAAAGLTLKRRKRQ
jgi:hypothetical protein